jgi:hypothetical protein
MRYRDNELSDTTYMKHNVDRDSHCSILYNPESASQLLSQAPNDVSEWNLLKFRVNNNNKAWSDVTSHCGKH